MPDRSQYTELVARIRQCRLCEPHLPLGARPVFQLHPEARILVAGQAPGIRVHRSGLPFDDPSGDRLREWMGVSREVFYDSSKLAIVPMGLCYPGTGKHGDLPPRAECAVAWRERMLAQLPRLELTLVIGAYAIAWHMPGAGKKVADAVRRWHLQPNIFALPHPSPRNNLWLRQHPWFEAEVVPAIRRKVHKALAR